MKELISESHKRCTAEGMLHNKLYSSKILKSEELNRVLNSSKELINAAKPFLQHLYDFVRGTGFMVLLCDFEGCIVDVIGDENILIEAKELKMLKGAYMDEVNMGTNAMSMALLEKEPVQISGKEHFVNAYYRWTCSAAPIKDSSGKVIGVIDLTGYARNVHPHTLGIVAAASKAIEKMLENNKYNKMLEISKKRLETTFDSISSGILTCDLNGNITSMNKEILRILGYKEYEMRKIKAYDIVSTWNEIVKKINNKIDVINEDTYINGKMGKFQYSLTIYPIYDSLMKVQEMTFVFHEMKLHRRLAGKILGGQAIYTFDKIIGKNENLINTINYAKKIAFSKSTVLITGESGTGKEIFAQSIHNFSSRKNEAFIAINCGAIPRTLIESELFGYVDGAFTGAKKGGNAGKFEIAEGGTIFLDEIGEMPMDMQMKLLRVIEEGTITRIGSSKVIPIDVRIIAATNKELIKEIEKGNFRKDLYYRLNVLPLYLPPLRERKDDIPELIKYYMNKTAKKLSKSEIELTAQQMNKIIEYDWPGNIRELENFIELIINSEEFRFYGKETLVKAQEEFLDVADQRLTLEEVEKNYIAKVLSDCKMNFTEVAKTLGIGRNTLYRKVEKYKISCTKLEHCSKMEHDFLS